MSDKCENFKISTWLDLGYKSIGSIAISIVTVVGIYISILIRLNTVEQRLDWTIKSVSSIEIEMRHVVELSDQKLDGISNKLTELRILVASQNAPRK